MQANATEQGKTQVFRPTEHRDILIIGAGISGIGMAAYLKKELPQKNFLILERRQAVGGTWDLFRYPGIRSDSDMNTFGYSFRPWKETRILSDGPSIRRYIEETAHETGVWPHIRFGLKAISASFDSKSALWTVNTIEEKTGSEKIFTARFLIAATGYYKYDQGYRPEFPGESNFRGLIIHPQHWPEDLDYTNKRVVVIGSGATAVTLVPAMAGKAKHVTMLQRSPTYILSIPSKDMFSENLRRFLPDNIVYQMARWRNILLQRGLYVLAKNSPAVVRRLILMAAKRELGDTTDIRHFSPHYNPWDERLCVVPDGDLFKALRSGKASVVTDHIETFTESGIRLKSGRELEADIIVTATGLELQLLGGMELIVDGHPAKINELLTYKAVLFEGIPNAALIFGYTNASWTLKVDLAAEYLCRLLKHMDRRQAKIVVARDKQNSRTEETVMGGLSSGYIRRAKDRLPRQGKAGVWRVTNDVLADTAMLRFLPVEDEALEFH